MYSADHGTNTSISDKSTGSLAVLVMTGCSWKRQNSVNRPKLIERLFRVESHEEEETGGGEGGGGGRGGGGDGGGASLLGWLRDEKEHS